MISRSQGLKLALGSLMGAMPAIFTGLIVVSGVVFIYAILGVSLFKGRFFHCRFERGRELITTDGVLKVMSAPGVID